MPDATTTFNQKIADQIFGTNSPAPATPEPSTFNRKVADDIFGKADETAIQSQSKKKEKELRGVLAETGSALGSGFASVGEAIAGTGEMLLDIPGSGTAREFFGRLQETDALKRPDYLQHETVLEHPERLADWRWWVRTTGENLPSLLTMVAPSAAVTKIGKAAEWGDKAIRAAGLAAGWSASMTIEAGSAYSQAKKEMQATGLYDEATIEDIATKEGLIAGTVNSIIELLPLDNLLFRQTGGDRLLKRIIRQGLFEGSTEITQEAVNVLVEQYGHKPDQKLGDNIGRLLEAGIAGGVLGAGTGAIVPPAQQGARASVLRSMGMKPAAASPSAAMPMTTAAKESQTTATEPARRAAMHEEQRTLAKNQGRTLFDAVAAEDLAEQTQLEAAKKADEIRRNEETARIAAQEQASRNASVANAQAEQSALIDALAGDDPKRQAIVNDVLGLSDRVLITSLQKELKLTIAPAGPGLYAIETATGPLPAGLFDLRRRLAEKRVADLDARRAKEAADEERLRQSAEEAARKKEEKRAADALAMSRQALYTALSGPTPAQMATLETHRDQLTADELARLDRFMGNAKQGTDVKLPLNPPLPKGETEGVVISETENKDTSVRREASDDKAPEETAMIDLMLSDLDNAGRGGQLMTHESGDTTRTNAGIPWLTSANAQGAKMDVNDARTVLAKAKKGETLTDRQQKMLEAILAAMRKLGGEKFTQALAWAEQGFIPVDNKKIPVRDMVEGDRYVVDNEEFGVTDIDEDGNVTLKDGTIKKLKDGEVLSGVDFVKPVEGAEDFNGEDFATAPKQAADQEAQKAKEERKKGQSAAVPEAKPLVKIADLTTYDPSRFAPGAEVTVTRMNQGRKFKVKVPVAEALQDLRDNRAMIKKLTGLLECVS